MTMAIVALPLTLPLDNNRPRQWWAGEFDGLASDQGDDCSYRLALVIQLRDPAELSAVQAHMDRLLGRMAEEDADV